jgi:hypothetical protein
MKEKRNSVIAWTVFALIVAVNIAAIISFYANSPEGETPAIFTILFPLVPVLFAFVGALIISRQPRNVIGLVMMLPGLGFTFVVDAYLEPYLNGLLPPPVSPAPLFLIAVWFSNWNWLLLLFPIMFIMLLFPTGRPLSPRWRWLVYYGIGIMVFLILIGTFAKEIGPGTDYALWQVPNPIGFLTNQSIDAATGPFLILFPLWIILCTASLFVRFRRAKAVERTQIKWLFYAGAVFVVFYLPSFIGNTYNQAENLWNLLLPIGMSTFPIAIAISILRYQLYDIDIIIRKTLQYALLTGLLALVYFGSVILLQSLTENLFGEQSPLVIVLSTLGIAALFNPLRIRIQEFIDRRFYRKKYDAEQALAQFAATARDEVDMDQLNAALLRVVDETMQPESVSLWLQQRK